MVGKMFDYVTVFLDKAHLDINRILFIYIDALILIPLLLGSFLIYGATMTRQALVAVLAQSPVTAIDVIVAITDFSLGYYLWLKKDELVTNLDNYHFLMVCQAISQIMVGNLFCFFLALFGVIRLNNMSNKKLQPKNKFIKIISLSCLVISSFYLGILIWLTFKNW